MTSERKVRHIQLCLDPRVENARPTGFEALALRPCSLPELSLGEIDCTTSFLGSSLAFPLLLGAISGGVELGDGINRNLARLARSHGLALSLGSMRPAIDDPGRLRGFEVRDIAGPDTPLLGNIGVWQLREPGLITRLLQIADRLELTGLMVHLNPAQELVQPEGERDFRGGLQALAELRSAYSGPLLVKEVGFGLSLETLGKLLPLGLAGVDVAGAGGTNFATVESRRTSEPEQIALGRELADFGLPTAMALELGAGPIRDSGAAVIAGGGIRRAADALKAIALGADLFSLARPLLAPALDSPEALDQWFRSFSSSFKALMLLTGCRNLEQARTGKILL